MTGALFSYPDAMRDDLDKAGVYPWTAGGEFKSLSEALEKASEYAEEKNMPIEVTWLGTQRTVYPKAVGYGR